MSAREELSDIVAYSMNNEFSDPSGRAADAIIAAGYTNVARKSMSAREQLAHAIATNLDRTFGKREFGPAHQDYELADALIDEGWRKVRVVTTVEELDALPAGSVILDPNGLSLHRNAFTGWRASNGAKNIPLDMLATEALPATVLWEPQP